MWVGPPNGVSLRHLEALKAALVPRGREEDVGRLSTKLAGCSSI